ncbi:MAG: SRPBCC family protein [Planctomycetes bacterium]|nr:SRPBCC family protein [Planctomycetota bacterium]
MLATATKHFKAPPEIVWEVMSDLENAADRIDAIVKLEILTEGPVGQGTRFKETRIMFKKEATETMEITSWNPPNSYTTEADGCGCHYTSVITCEKDGDGTLVTMSFEAEAMSAFGKIMSALTGWMMKSVCAKAFDKDLENLKNFVESQAPQPA